MAPPSSSKIHQNSIRELIEYIKPPAYSLPGRKDYFAELRRRQSLVIKVQTKRDFRAGTNLIESIRFAQTEPLSVYLRGEQARKMRFQIWLLGAFLQSKLDKKILRIPALEVEVIG